MQLNQPELSPNEKDMLDRIVANTGLQIKYGHGVHRHYDAMSTPWQPLSNDGDALKLALQAGLSVTVSPAGFTVKGDTTSVTGISTDDTLKDLRRAIVETADQELSHKKA